MHPFAHHQVAELRDAADYFLLPFTASTIKCQNLRGLLHELSNDGAQSQFEEFLEELILPQMVSLVQAFFFVRTIFVQNGKWSPFLELTPTL